MSITTITVKMSKIQDKEIDIFVASRIGAFKHIKYHTDRTKNSKKFIENLVDVKTLQKGDAITCMRWANKEQTEILIGRKNQVIETYSTLRSSSNTYTAPDEGTIEGPVRLKDNVITTVSSGVIETYSTLTPTPTTFTSPDEGTIVGLARLEDKLISAVSSGVVRIWPDEILKTGGKLDVMAVESKEVFLATGGEENDLKLYSLGRRDPFFTAKNLAHDNLQLRRPIWVSGACFAPRSGGRLVAVCSRHGYVRLYDWRVQRRPVLNVEFPNMAATCITPSFDNRNFLVGFGRGQLTQVDMRMGRPDKSYKGCVGAVTDIATVKDGRLIVSTSLDRHLRVHDYKTKEMIYKQYLTSKLTQVLVQTENSTPLKSQILEIKQEIPDESGQEEDMDVIFDNMETVGEKPKKKQVKNTKRTNIRESPKIKPSTHGWTVPDTRIENAIRKLLRSTEKLKRKRKQLKSLKAAKSVFNNC